MKIELCVRPQAVDREVLRCRIAKFGTIAVKQPASVRHLDRPWAETKNASGGANISAVVGRIDGIHGGDRSPGVVVVRHG